MQPAAPRRRSTGAAPRGRLKTVEAELRGVEADVEKARAELWSKAGDGVAGRYCLAELAAVEEALAADVARMEAARSAAAAAHRARQDEIAEGQADSVEVVLQKRKSLYEGRLVEEEAADAERVKHLEEACAEARAHVLRLENDVAVLRRYLDPDAAAATPPPQPESTAAAKPETAPPLPARTRTASWWPDANAPPAACVAGAREVVSLTTPEGAQAHAGVKGSLPCVQEALACLASTESPQSPNGLAAPTFGSRVAQALADGGKVPSLWRVAEYLKFMSPPGRERPLWGGTVVRQLLKDMRTLWTRHSRTRRWDEVLPLYMMSYAFVHDVLWAVVDVAAAGGGEAGGAPELQWRVVTTGFDDLEASYTTSQHVAIPFEGSWYEPAGASHAAQWWLRRESHSFDLLVRYEITASNAGVPLSSTVLWVPAPAPWSVLHSIPARAGGSFDLSLDGAGDGPFGAAPTERHTFPGLASEAYTKGTMTPSLTPTTCTAASAVPVSVLSPAGLPNWTEAVTPAAVRLDSAPAVGDALASVSCLSMSDGVRAHAQAWEEPIDLVAALPPSPVLEYLHSRPWDEPQDFWGGGAENQRWSARSLIPPHLPYADDLRACTDCDARLAAVTQCLAWESLSYVEVAGVALHGAEEDDVDITLSLTSAVHARHPNAVYSTRIAAHPATVQLPTEADFYNTFIDPALTGIAAAASYEEDPAAAVADAYGKLQLKAPTFLLVVVYMCERAEEVINGVTPKLESIGVTDKEATVHEAVHAALTRVVPEACAPHVVFSRTNVGVEWGDTKSNPKCACFGIADRGGHCGTGAAELDVAAAAADKEVISKVLRTALQEAIAVAGWSAAGVLPTVVLVTYPEALQHPEAAAAAARDMLENHFGMSGDAGRLVMMSHGCATLQVTLLFLTHGASVSQQYLSPYVLLPDGATGSGVHEVTSSDTHVIKAIDGAVAGQLFSEWCGHALANELKMARKRNHNVYIEKGLPIFLKLDTMHGHVRKSVVVAPLAVTPAGGLLVAERIALKARVQCCRIGDVAETAKDALRHYHKDSDVSARGAVLILPHRYSLLPVSALHTIHSSIVGHLPQGTCVAVCFSTTTACAGNIEQHTLGCVSSALPLLVVFEHRTPHRPSAHRTAPRPALAVKVTNRKTGAEVGRGSLNLGPLRLLEAAVGVVTPATPVAPTVFPSSDEYDGSGPPLEVAVPLTSPLECHTRPPLDRPSVTLALRTLKRRLLPVAVPAADVVRAVIENGVNRAAREQCGGAGASCQSQVCITAAEARELLEMQLLCFEATGTYYLLKLSGAVQVVVDLSTPMPQFQQREVPSMLRDKHTCWVCGLTSLHTMRGGFVHHQGTARLFCNGCVHKARVVPMVRLKRPCEFQLCSVVNDAVHAAVTNTPRPPDTASLQQLAPFIACLSRALHKLEVPRGVGAARDPCVYRRVSNATWRACAPHTIVAWSFFSQWCVGEPPKGSVRDESKLLVLAPLPREAAVSYSHSPRRPHLLLPCSALCHVVRVDKDATYLEEVPVETAVDILRRKGLLTRPEVDVAELLTPDAARGEKHAQPWDVERL